MGNRFTLNPGVRADFIHGNNPTVGNAYAVTNVAPRLGFAWDVTGNFNTVVKGAYSQYYEATSATAFERAVPGVSPRHTYDVSVPGKKTLTDTVPAIVYKLDPNIKHPRVDEVYGAVERALSRSMRLTVTRIYRESKNFINS